MKHLPYLTQQFIQSAIANPLQNQKCSQIHPGISCNEKMIYQFVSTSRNIYKVYMFVHLIHLFQNIFKNKQKIKPFHQVFEFFIGLVKSLLFAAGHMTLAKRIVCLLTEYYKFNSSNAVIGVLLGAVTVNFQPVGRQAEIALFSVNKSLQTLYHMAKRRKYPVCMPYGQGILLGFAVGIISYYYAGYPKAIRKTYLTILQYLIGDI